MSGKSSSRCIRSEWNAGLSIHHSCKTAVPPSRAVILLQRAARPYIGSRAQLGRSLALVRCCLNPGHEANRSVWVRKVPQDEIASAIARCAGYLADSVATKESIYNGEGSAIH